ncbi:MAG: hypothetical protein ACI9LY_003510, partial [Arenicella sp.]
PIQNIGILVSHQLIYFEKDNLILVYAAIQLY